jgi:adenylate kinase family enzyme
MRDVVLTGLPGCGKGTLVRSLLGVAADSLVAVATGDIARRISAESARSGAMAPEDRMRSELLMEIARVRPANGAVLVDGLPRKAEQVGWAQENLCDPLFVYLDTAPSVCKQRMALRGRADDTPEFIERRMAEHTALLSAVLAEDADWLWLSDNDEASAHVVLEHLS